MPSRTSSVLRALALIALGASILTPTYAVAQPDRGYEPEQLLASDEVGEPATESDESGPTVDAAPLADLTLVGTAPEAASSPTASGRRIQTLTYDAGRLYYGHGDYADNTGSMSGRGTAIAYHDVLSGGFETALDGFATEEVNTIRAIDGSLYAPAIDPSAAAGPQSSYARGDDDWSANPTGAPSVHVFDVAGTDAGLYLATGDHDGGGVWHSADDGASWSRSLHGTDAQNDGFERYYWLGTIDGELYTRMHHGWDQGTSTSGIMRLDAVAGWTPVRRSPDFGLWSMRGSDVQSFDGRLWAFRNDTVDWFDGRRGRSVDPKVGMVTAITADSSGLYVLGTDGVARIDAKGKARPVVAAGMGGLARATAIAVGGGRLWLGTEDARIWSRWL